MLELPLHLRLRNEAIAVEGLLREVLVEALQRDLAQEVLIDPGVHVAYAAATDFGLEHEVGRARDLLGGDDLGGKSRRRVDREPLVDQNLRKIRLQIPTAHG
ncbi:MAG: hypothetical protein FJ096_21380 [Deltaproteobacteria bacterium]|nr:hypothetical protein [Deltaproteobacteria bacterium]